MLGSSSQCSGSSSRACLHGDWMKNAHRDRGGKVPRWCCCGLRPVFRWSGTDSNLERPFYGCPNYNIVGKRWFDFFKRADVEEEDVIVGKNETPVSEDHWKISLRWKISAVEAEIKILKIWNIMFSLFVITFGFVMVAYGLGGMKYM